MDRNEHMLSQNTLRVEKEVGATTEEEQPQSMCQCVFQIIRFLCDFAKLYSFADGREKAAILAGVLIGVGSGVSHPIFIYLWCQELQMTLDDNATLSEHMGEFRNYLYYFIGLGVGVLVVNGLLFMVWKYVSRAISKKIRVVCLEHYIRQSVAALEQKNGYEWANNFKMNTLNIEKSIGDKVALLLNLTGIVVSGVIAAVSIRWTLSFQVMMLVPPGILVLLWFISIQIRKREINIEANREAQEKSLETTTMIKTVKMLNGEEKEVADYVTRLEKGEQELDSFSWKLGTSTGIFYLIQYLFFGLGSIMGIQCIRGTSFCPVSITGSRYQISEVVGVFFQMFFCTFNFLQLGSNYNAIKSAIASSKEIYKFIEESPIVEERVNMAKPEKLGKISFRNVSFSYPLNREKRVLNNLSIDFLENKFNAIVGTTGCGKSTIIQLLLKQYQREAGLIAVGDGVDLDEVSTSYWLDRIGIVTQQPVLFTGTIRENVLVGKPDATEEEVIEALTEANIYEFISQKPEGLDFQIGVGGSKLSGGQKQRVAIARALVKKPHLLILDEATSALDRKTERQIQETIEKIRRNRESKLTIICIAHRLKTIESADRIFFIQEGRVVESGVFEEISYFRSIEPTERALLYESCHRMNKKNSLISERNISLRQTLLRVKVEEPQISEASIYPQLFQYTTYKKWYIFCLFLALLIGACHAVSGIILSYGINQMNFLYLLGVTTNWCDNLIANSALYQSCLSSLDGYFYESEKFLYGLLGFAVFQFLPYFAQITMLSKIENEISFNLRKNLYEKLLHLEVKFYERPENESGGAASRFGHDSRACCELLTTYVPIVLSNFCTVVAAVVICFSFSWKFGVLSMMVTPLIALSYYIAMLFIGGYEDSSLELMHEADQIANELIVSIKTALALNYQDRLLEKYKRFIDEPLLDILKVGAKIGVLYGCASLILEVVVGLALYLVVVIYVDDPSIEPLTIIIFMIVSILSGFITGNNFFFIAHISAGKEAGARIMKLVHSKTEKEKQNPSTPTEAKDKWEIEGHIEFKNVNFRYKDDDEKLVLNNVSFVIEPGMKVGFVGPSGCGKSTILQLLLRFYEFEGEILLDGKNIFEYSLEEYRAYFGMLNQEPSLFAGSIEENIRYNMLADNEIAANEVLIYAAEKACAYTLNTDEPLERCIKTFLERRVGPKGSNISGGEKQRVACARALLRDSRVFLMDEGTSALDIITERKVLNGMMEELETRTMVNVAHRIETIKDSDRIFLFDQGELRESGSYEELMEKKRYFYNFAQGNKISA